MRTRKTETLPTRQTIAWNKCNVRNIQNYEEVLKRELKCMKVISVTQIL